VLFATVVVEGSVLLIALGIGWYRGASPWSFIRWEASAVLWAMLATLPPVVLGWLMLRFPVGPLRSLRALSQKLVRQVFAGSPIWQLAFVSAWAGVAEELLFRGVIQQLASERFGLLTGLLIGSVLFGFAHPLSALYFIFTALMGVYLGWIWIASDYNLLVPMIVHGLYDFLLLALMVRGFKNA
jgi:membrane protease YdiL (CAAX protease family)